MNTTNELKNYPVLEQVIKTLQGAIADLKVEKLAASEFVVKDGDDEIVLAQETGENGAIIRITDTRNIIYSEDLLGTFQNLSKNVRGDDQLKADLETATIIINGLDLETELVFQAVKDFLDQVSNSYEFFKMVEADVTKIGSGFKFGKHIFRLNITNNTKQIVLEPRFTPTFDAGIQQTIVKDIAKVQQAVNKMFNKVA